VSAVSFSGAFEMYDMAMMSVGELRSLECELLDRSQSSQ
jgi:hypothetical protein